MSEVDRLIDLRRAAEILGAMPSGDLGTQEPEYRAYKILTDEIECIDGLDHSKEDKCAVCGVPLTDADAIACRDLPGCQSGNR